MSLFVIYGFDTASTLSEETKDPRRAAPKAVLFSVDRRVHHRRRVPARHAGGHPQPARGDQGRLRARPRSSRPTSPHPFATLYLLVVSAAIFVCCLSIMAATIRLCFGMSRDNQLPFSQPLSRVRRACTPRSGPASRSRCSRRCRSSSTRGRASSPSRPPAMIYLSYFLGNIVILRARLRGWPKTSAPFRLGRWGLVVNIVGLLYGGAMLVNFAWPRAASNPKPNQTVIAACSAQLPHRLPEQDPDPVDGVHRHRADRGDLLPGRRAQQGVRAGDRTVAGRPAARGRSGRGLPPSPAGRTVTQVCGECERADVAWTGGHG